MVCIVAIPTSLTGLLDWADLSKGSRARTLANYHLTVMILATASFAVTWVLQRPGYLDGEVTIDGLIAGCVALGLLTLGGTLGGALAYVYGVRVVKRDVSIMDALIPARSPSRAPCRVQAQAVQELAHGLQRRQPAASTTNEAPYVAGTAVRPGVPVAAGQRRPGRRRRSPSTRRYILSKK